MKLNLCEGHVLGQVYSAVRGYVWKEKVSHNSRSDKCHPLTLKLVLRHRDNRDGHSPHRAAAAAGAGGDHE